MSSLSVRLPDSLHEKVRELARRDDVSINQFIATAVAEKASALLTVDYLKQRARRAEPELFARLLNGSPMLLRWRAMSFRPSCCLRLRLEHVAAAGG